MKKQSNKKQSSPLALFDALEFINFNLENVISSLSKYKDICIEDFKQGLNFLKCYKGSKGTFNSYRREIEKLLHWSWSIAKKTLKELKREDLESFIYFSKKPKKSWIGITKYPRFINDKKGLRIPNSKWKPFVSTISKSEYKKGKKPNINDFELSEGAIKELLAILSSFYNYLLQEEYINANVISLIRQKSKFIRKKQTSHQIRRLTNLQWQYVINTAKKMAENNPCLHERTLFIMSALYSMYLRISELTANERWTPCMNDFYRSHDGTWWFITVGKGNKERQIAVSDTMLNALKRWRTFLSLSPLPTPADNSPILPKLKGKGPISSSTYLREIIQNCFDNAIENLKIDNHQEEAASLLEATVHWLRHTGISEDVKIRPREHVRDDAGHSSSATTDKYIDIELKERHASAKDKQILNEEN